MSPGRGSTARTRARGSMSPRPAKQKERARLSGLIAWQARRSAVRSGVMSQQAQKAPSVPHAELRSVLISHGKAVDAGVQPAPTPPLSVCSTAAVLAAARGIRDRCPPVRMGAPSRTDHPNARDRSPTFWILVPTSESSTRARSSWSMRSAAQRCVCTKRRRCVGPVSRLEASVHSAALGCAFGLPQATGARCSSWAGKRMETRDTRTHAGVVDDARASPMPEMLRCSVLRLRSARSGCR